MQQGSAALAHSAQLYSPISNGQEVLATLMSPASIDKYAAPLPGTCNSSLTCYPIFRDPLNATYLENITKRLNDCKFA